MNLLLKFNFYPHKMTSGYFFGKKIKDYKPYLLLGVYYHDIFHCGSYYCDSNGRESITAINSGEVFYSLREFVVSIIGLHSTDEWMECSIFDETSDPDGQRWGEIGYFYLENDE